MRGSLRPPQLIDGIVSVLQHVEPVAETLRDELTGPNSFWAKLGPQNVASAEPPTVGSPGAGWDYVPGLDPPCANCSVNTSATPEPGAFGLLASSLGGLILMLRRRRK